MLRDDLEITNCNVAPYAAGDETEVSVCIGGKREAACAPNQALALCAILCRVALASGKFASELSGCQVTEEGGVCRADVCLIHSGCFFSGSGVGRDIPQAIQEAWWMAYQDTFATLSI